MSYYMTNVIISPTLYEEKRLEAISYFSRCSREAALRIHKKNKYKDIKLKLNTIAVAIIEAKKRYFDDCSFGAQDAMRFSGCIALPVMSIQFAISFSLHA